MNCVDVSKMTEIFGIEDTVLFAEKLRKFVDRLDKDTLELSEFVHVKNLDQVCHTAHKLKSASRMVGAVGLGDLFETLEKKAADGEAQLIEDLFDEILAEAVQVKQFVANYP